METNELRLILQTDYYRTILDTLRAVQNNIQNEYNKNTSVLTYEDYMVISLSKYNKILYDTINEITENIKKLDPIQIPLFFDNLKSEISREYYESDIYTMEYSYYNSEYCKFIESLNVEHYLKTKALPPNPGESKQIEPSEDISIQGKITKQQAVLIFEYILNELNALNNATKRSDLISFLTGFPIQGIRKKHSAKGINHIDDLKIIRPYLENLNLDSIVKKINREITNEV